MLNSHYFLMLRQLVSISLFFILLVALSPVTSAALESPVLLFFSGNIQGETEPCG